MHVRRGAGRHIHLELGEKRLKIRGPQHPHIRYWHPFIRDRYSSGSGKLSEHGVIRQQFAFLGQVEEGADARVEQGLEFAPRPWCAHVPRVLSSEQQPIDDPIPSPESVCAFFSREESLLAFYRKRGCGTAGWCPTPTAALCGTRRFPARAERRARNARH